MTASEAYVSTYEVSVDGQVVEPPLANQIESITIDDSLGLPDVCTLIVTFAAPNDEYGYVPKIEESPFKLGGSLVVKLGEIAQNARPKELFNGIVMALEPVFASAVRLEVRAYDITHNLHARRATRTWADSSFEDVIREVCEDSSVDVTIEQVSGTFEHLQQTNESNWAFLKRLTGRLGLELAVSKGRLKVRAPRALEPVALEYPYDIVSFRPRVSSVQQVKSVKVTGYDAMQASTFSGVASRVSDQHNEASGLQRSQTLSKAEELHIVAPVQNREEAQTIAQGVLDRIANSYVHAEGTLMGNPKVKAGVTVDMQGLGTTYSGKYRVYSTRHTLSGGSSFVTSFTTYPATSVAELVRGATNAAVTGPGGRGFADNVVVGVVKDNNDPDGLGRVNVWFPVLEGNDRSHWARVVNMGAGDQYGVFMLPEVGAEVLVAFEHGDTARPYVIGTLWNGKVKPEPEHVDHEKSPFVVRSPTKAIVRSDEEMELTAGKTYLLKVAGDATHTFEAKLNIDATGDVKLAVKQGGMTIEAMRDITIKTTGGGNITMEAQGQMSLKANMGLTLDGGAQTNVKGAMINLG